MNKISTFEYLSNRGSNLYHNMLPTVVIIILYCYLQFDYTIDYFGKVYEWEINIVLLTILYVPFIILMWFFIYLQFSYLVEIKWGKQLRESKNGYILLPGDIVYEWATWDIILWGQAKIINPPQWVVILEDKQINVIQTRKWEYEYIKNSRKYTIWDKVKYNIGSEMIWFHNWYYVWWHQLIRKV